MDELFQFFKAFYPISPAAQEAITAISTEISMARNKDLQPIGHSCKTIYFLKKGIARIYYYKDGIDVTESFEFEHSIVARVESLFSGRPSRKGIQIVEDAELIAIDANKLFKLYDAFPEIERLFRKIFEAAHVNLVNRLESLQFHTAEERYNDLIKESPEILQRVPLKHIASYLGITQVSLSRIRAKR
ncbi:Crp/Fnr family transcriptional regulator [Pontibacter anaerobius]|uniref:Crp/Fnr family transcriptional regulator n=1 Tax=Pontibacter anaerobius TaxID=2993940 RepID=A0ABT3RHI1_9BACT|nr:Crp/Fnr family transcriptional regulator [Pontibacter anaerobius]MCX2740859.1 Crp/Fnr family transcriptional regulator [Pontibacter anaerobius]